MPVTSGAQPVTAQQRGTKSDVRQRFSASSGVVTIHIAVPSFWLTGHVLHPSDLASYTEVFIVRLLRAVQFMELRHLRYFRAQLEGVARSAQICLDVLDILGGNGPAAGNYIARHRGRASRWPFSAQLPIPGRGSQVAG